MERTNRWKASGSPLNYSLILSSSFFHSKLFDLHPHFSPHFSLLTSLTSSLSPHFLSPLSPHSLLIVPSLSPRFLSPPILPPSPLIRISPPVQSYPIPVAGLGASSLHEKNTPTDSIVCMILSLPFNFPIPLSDKTRIPCPFSPPTDLPYSWNAMPWDFSRHWLRDTHPSQSESWHTPIP